MRDTAFRPNHQPICLPRDTRSFGMTVQIISGMLVVVYIRRLNPKYGLYALLVEYLALTMQ